MSRPLSPENLGVRPHGQRGPDPWDLGTQTQVCAKVQPTLPAAGGGWECRKWRGAGGAPKGLSSRVVEGQDQGHRARAPLSWGRDPWVETEGWCLSQSEAGFVSTEGQKIDLPFLSCPSCRLDCPSVSCCLNTASASPTLPPVYPSAQRAPRLMLVSAPCP